MLWWYIALYAGGAFSIAVTLLPMWHTTYGWVRLWDFPRFQVGIISSCVLLLIVVFDTPAHLAQWCFAGLLLGASIWQWVWVYPFLPFASKEMGSCRDHDSNEGRISLLTINVLQINRNVERLTKVIIDADPDVVFMVEVDEWWTTRLNENLHGKFPHKVSLPLSNGYGLALFSRLELIDPEIRFVVDDAIPSIRTSVKLQSGASLALYGVHPRPPAPQQPSAERDTELLQVGEEIKARAIPSIVLGDLNDVAWSATTARFVAAGTLVDPRRGRGFFNTYPSRWPGLRYPLDYVFTTKHFRVRRMKVLEDVGSDHLPLIAEFCLK